MERSGATFIALQELDRFNPRSGEVDQPAELARLTGLDVTFVPTLSRDGWEYGIAIATRGTFPPSQSVELPRLATEEPRKAIVVEWRGLNVFATHLAVEPRIAALQARRLRELAEPLARPVVLGDLNAPRRALGPWRERFSLPRPVGPSVDPWWRFRQIDHVLCGPGVVPLRATRVPGRASDHRCVAVSLRWAVADVTPVTYDG
jgi:endonuclease/exonuclease/phosphatase family metal-dependent hydrolase